MSGLAPAIRQIRNARQEVAPPEAAELDQYIQQYRHILTEIDTVDETAMMAVADWIKGYIYETNELPEPQAVRTAANRICTGRGLNVDLERPD